MIHIEKDIHDFYLDILRQLPKKQDLERLRYENAVLRARFYLDDERDEFGDRA